MNNYEYANEILNMHKAENGKVVKMLQFGTNFAFLS